MMLLASEDPQVLIETTRLMSTFISHEETKSSWLKYVKDSASSMMLQLLTFMLKSSTNGTYLLHVCVGVLLWTQSKPHSHSRSPLLSGHLSKIGPKKLTIKFCTGNTYHVFSTTLLLIRCVHYCTSPNPQWNL